MSKLEICGGAVDIALLLSLQTLYCACSALALFAPPRLLYSEDYRNALVHLSDLVTQFDELFQKKM